ncbi:UNVERIFIED_CONTAM: hypothetical protein PYX00_004121 [Menopon gallinae]|uniref:Uncharacterized protein n=1 Tax=Menopon gallinae TaxID=328185 RepID=A0AAW2I2Y4_9NEOP
MSEYDCVKRGKFTIKGETSRKRKHKKSKKERNKYAPEKDEDAVKHGGWWEVKKIDDITGPVCIEFSNMTYVKALDNGLFTLGAPHAEGEGPSPEEILTAFNSIVTGRSDAVGTLEQWEPVFQDGKLALLGSNDCFMSVEPSDDSVVAKSRTAGVNEFIKIRSSATSEKDPDSHLPTEEKGNLSQIEENFVRKFQKFQDKKLKICQDDRDALKKAKQEGNLREALLDRRVKMKADRYCK